MSSARPRSYPASVLVYHHIYTGDRRGCPMKDAVHLDAFERQMRVLKERGFNVLPLSGLVSAMERGKALPRKTVVLTFDDGYRSTYTRALPVLLKYGFAACVFLATDYLPGISGPPENACRFGWLAESDRGDEDARPMSWQDAQFMAAGGMEIGSHTASHRFPPRMAPGEVESELVRSKKRIEAMLGISPIAVALPFSFPIAHGRWPSFESDLEAAMKRASYRCCCTLQRGPVRYGEGTVYLPRVAVTGGDTLLSFYAKALGLYRHTGLPQRIYQAFFKKYGL